MFKLSWMIAVALLFAGCTSEVVDSASSELAVTTSECELRGFGGLAAGDFFMGRVVGEEGGAAEGVWFHLGPPIEDDDDDDTDEDVDEDSDEGCRDDHHRGRHRRGRGHHGHRRGRGHHDHGNGHGHGHGNHDHGERDIFVGSPDSIVCRINGASIADVEGQGSGTLNGDPGYNFNIRVDDLDDPDPDFYFLQVTDSDGNVAYTASGEVVEGAVSVATTQL